MRLSTFLQLVTVTTVPITSNSCLAFILRSESSFRMEQQQRRTTATTTTTTTMPIMKMMKEDTTTTSELNPISTTIIVGLNGALQKRFILSTSSDPYLIPGNVHRAERIQIGVGGKGQDVAITLSCLEYNKKEQEQQQDSFYSYHDKCTHLAQFIGTGPEGDTVLHLLSDMFQLPTPSTTENDDSSIMDVFMPLTVRPTTCGMRTCTSIIASDSTTELVEPSGTILETDIIELKHKLNQLKQQGTKAVISQSQQQQQQHQQQEIKLIPTVVDAICFMGSMPPGCPDTLYSDIYNITATDQTLCVIDSVIGLPSLISTIANTKKQQQQHDTNNNTNRMGGTIFKVNASELRKLAGVVSSGTTITSEADGVPIQTIVQSIEQFLIKYPDASEAFTAIAITDGKHPAYVAEIISTSGTSSSSSDKDSKSKMFHLYQIPIQPLTNEQGVLYPIGAGDSVAAGTLAAWKCLSDYDLYSNNNNDNNNANSCCLPTNIQSSLVNKRNEQYDTNTSTSKTVTSTVTSGTILTAFAFGLACGSASCLEEGNSIVQIPTVLSIFDSMKSSHLDPVM